MKQQTTPTSEGKQYIESVFEKWYVDAGDYQRNKDADEIFIRISKRSDYTESYDICRFGCDETGEPLEKAKRIVKCVNNFDALAKALEVALDTNNSYLQSIDAMIKDATLDGMKMVLQDSNKIINQVLKNAGLG